MQNWDEIGEFEVKCFSVLLLQVSQPLPPVFSSPSTKKTPWRTPEIWEKDTLAMFSSCRGCVSLSSWSAQSCTSTCTRRSARQQDGKPPVWLFSFNRKGTWAKMIEKWKPLLKWCTSLFYKSHPTVQHDLMTNELHATFRVISLVISHLSTSSQWMTHRTFCHCGGISVFFWDSLNLKTKSRCKWWRWCKKFLYRNIKFGFNIWLWLWHNHMELIYLFVFLYVFVKKITLF